MSTAQLRRKIKKEVDNVSPKRLEALAEYVAFLNRPTLEERITKARKEFAAGKGVDWRKVRSHA